MSEICSMEVWHNAGYSAISQNVGSLRLQHYKPVEETFKFLKVTALVVKLEFIQVAFEYGRRLPGLYAKVRYSPTLDVFILKYWDVDQAIQPGSEDGKIELPCVVVMENKVLNFMRGQDPRLEDEMQILVLRQHDNHYERVGCFSWEQGDFRGFARNNQGCEVMSPMYGQRWSGKDDGRYWLRDGVKTTFLLG